MIEGRFFHKILQYEIWWRHLLRFLDLLNALRRKSGAILKDALRDCICALKWFSKYEYPVLLMSLWNCLTGQYFLQTCLLSRIYSLTFQSPLVTWYTNILKFNNCTLCPQCIYVFCINLRTNSDLCHLQHKLVGFYNRDEKCLQLGTDRVFN